VFRHSGAGPNPFQRHSGQAGIRSTVIPAKAGILSTVIPAQAGIQTLLKRLAPDSKSCREVTKNDDF
jgi:hypothetical protein